MELHVADCAECRAELVELAPLPGLLRHTPFDELPDSVRVAESLSPAREQAPPVEEPLPRRQEEQRQDEQPQPAQPPHGRRGRAMAAAGLALAAVVAGVVVYAATNTGHTTVAAAPAAAATWSATNPATHVSATAAVTPKSWGTEFQLVLSGLPAGITCHLVVHAQDGHSETAGTWGSGYNASTTVPASTSVSPSHITGLDVVDGSGTLLVHMPPTH